MKILIHFRHGLGDAVQFTEVLRHLQVHRSNWEVDVSTLVGKHSAFEPLCHKVYVQGQQSPPCCQYEQRYDLDWHECQTSYSDSPSTKAERCLREVFGMTPDRNLCRYVIPIGDAAKSRARDYLEQLCQQAGVPVSRSGHDVATGNSALTFQRYPVVLIHYEGNTSSESKNIPTDIISRLCGDIIESGHVPVILDWDRRTPLIHPKPDGSPSGIYCPDADNPLWQGTGTGDAESLAALIELSSLMIGVDSGPLHVAGATSTPTLGVWTRHHPVHYFGHADHVTHLVPLNHAESIRGTKSVGEAYFKEHYRFQTYQDLEDGLRVAVRGRLSPPQDANGLIFTRGFWIRGDNGEQDLVVVRDIAEQDSYQIDKIPRPGPVVVDVGGHIGCFAKRLYRRNPQARIVTVECCPENIPVLQKNIGEFATVVQGAVTYEPDVALLNAVYAQCKSTGGSAVISRDELQARVAAHEITAQPNGETESEYWADFRALRTFTLEDLMAENQFERIDVLKLDCEGSEFSILGKTTSLDRIGLIVGEYHGKDKFKKLVSERFGDWNLEILHDGELGTFWLTNPNSAANVAPTNGHAHGFPETVGRRMDRAGTHAEQPVGGDASVPLSRDEFSQRLSVTLHPQDRAEWDKLLPYYYALFEVVQKWQPRTIVEIGVRGGYSALSMLLANPRALLLGIDADDDEQLVLTHTGRKGFWRHACQILEPFNFHLLLADSHSLKQLPAADLVYIDGDHSYRGCLADLRLAAKTSNRILVDDYDSLPSVRQACDTFTSEHPEFHRRYVDNGLTGFLIFERNSLS